MGGVRIVSLDAQRPGFARSHRVIHAARSPAEVAFSLVIPVFYGTIPHIPEDLTSRNIAYTEVCPSLLLGFPRMWETHAARALVDIETASG